MEGMGLWKEQWPQGDLPASPGVEHLPGAAAVVAGERFLCLLLRGCVPTG